MKEPTSFLSLPAELRQRILLLSRDTCLNPNEPGLHGPTGMLVHDRIIRKERKSVKLWTGKLCQVHPVLKEDVMEFAYRKWMKKLAECDRSGHTMRTTSSVAGGLLHNIWK